MSAENVIKLFKHEVKFIAGAARIDQIPKLHLAEIAFIGRSNVGKSSLINAICNHHNLARVSHTPGRTQQINFFDISGKLTIVDLPGYGFAKVPSRTKNQWEQLIDYYLQNRKNLNLVNILIDSRRGLQDLDKRMIDILINYSRNFQIVFTKLDKQRNIEELASSYKNYLETLPYPCNVIYTSSKSKHGTKELQFSFTKFV